jgi:23S rRNA pseudouridine1911/1915/1917 synthase
LNHPLIGDKLYGSSIENDILLHSYHLDFIHPITNKKIDITLPLNEDFNNFINKQKELQL